MVDDVDNAIDVVSNVGHSSTKQEQREATQCVPFGCCDCFVYLD